MSSEEFSPTVPASADFEELPPREVPPARLYPRHRYWLHALLLLLTVCSTTLVGARMQWNFDHNLPFMSVEEVWNVFTGPWQRPESLAGGLPFSLTLLTILLAHEAGHFLACVRYNLNASLPYFIPAPVLIGTFGAFIRIRSPIYSRSALFDVAVAGPIAGFVFIIPALGIGLALSKVLPGIVVESELRFGMPALLSIAQKLVFPFASAGDVYLHPVARAASIGLLATAWNLLPIGQLDGGHILYSFAGRSHRLFSILFIVGLLAMGAFFWRGWIVWAVLLFFSRKHPSIYDPEPLGAVRANLGWLALAIFLLSFTVSPIQEKPGL